MGVPGQSAFTPYTRPPQHWGSPRPSGGGFTGGVAARASNSGGAAQIGESPMARKRDREDGTAAGGSPPVEGALSPVNCSVCGKMFPTPKALFRHMRSHPGRGWKGAHPPPTFNAEEEFADLRAGVGDAADGGVPEEGGGGRVAEEDEEGKNCKVPDLNNPPPQEDPSN
ncbi:hypothetical protein ACS0TY_029016 [Phlomoides rotata]